MVTYCTSYTNNRTWQISCKYTGIKICYKIDKFAFEGNKSKVVRGIVLTFKKRSPLQKKKSFRNAALFIYPLTISRFNFFFSLLSDSSERKKLIKLYHICVCVCVCVKFFSPSKLFPHHFTNWYKFFIKRVVKRELSNATTRIGLKISSCPTCILIA